MGLLEIEGLTKLYRNGTRANDGVTMSVEAGEIRGLLGPNGAGKTTLVRQVLSITTPTSGRIRIAGEDIVANAMAARRLCSYQPQGQVPMEGLTPRQAIPLIGRIRGLQSARSLGFVESYRGMLPRFWRVVVAQLLTNLIVSVLAIAVIGLPIAIWKYVDWQFVQQEILFEDKRIRDAFRGSTLIVRRQWWRAARVAGFLWLLSVATGPLLIMLLIFADLSLNLVDALGSIIFALLLPYVATGRTLLYFDLAARHPEAVRKPTRRRRLWSRLRPAAGTA